MAAGRTLDLRRRHTVQQPRPCECRFGPRARDRARTARRPAAGRASSRDEALQLRRADRRACRRRARSRTRPGADSRLSMEPRSHRSRVRRQSSQAAHRVPEPRRVHALAAVVGGLPPVLAPEEASRPAGTRAACCGRRCAGSGSGSAGSRCRCSPRPRRWRGGPGGRWRSGPCRGDRVWRGTGRPRAGSRWTSGPKPSRSTRWPMPRNRRSPRAARPRWFERGRAAATLSSRQRNCSTGRAPLPGQPSALAQQAGRVGVLEAVHRVAEDQAVAPVEVRILVVVVPRHRAVGQDLVEVGRAHVAEDAVAVGGVVARHGAPQLRQHGQRRPGDAHVVDGLVVAAVGVHELGQLEDVVEARAACSRRGRPRAPPPKGGPRPRRGRSWRGRARAACGCGSWPARGRAATAGRGSARARASSSPAIRSLSAASKAGEA